MLFLVALANQGVPDGAYLLSKLYARGLTRTNLQVEGEEEGGETQTVLVSRNLAKAAVWTVVSCNLAKKTRKTEKEQAYFAGKLNERLEKLEANNVP